MRPRERLPEIHRSSSFARVGTLTGQGSCRPLAERGLQYESVEFPADAIVRATASEAEASTLSNSETRRAFLQSKAQCLSMIVQSWEVASTLETRQDTNSSIRRTNSNTPGAARKSNRPESDAAECSTMFPLSSLRAAASCPGTLAGTCIVVRSIQTTELSYRRLHHGLNVSHPKHHNEWLVY